MGILNTTPDSFSDGGLHSGTSAAIDHALKMVRDGADIVDIGGESTRREKRLIHAISKHGILCNLGLTSNEWKIRKALRMVFEGIESAIVVMWPILFCPSRGASSYVPIRVPCPGGISTYPVNPRKP